MEILKKIIFGFLWLVFMAVAVAVVAAVQIGLPTLFIWLGLNLLLPLFGITAKATAGNAFGLFIIFVALMFVYNVFAEKPKEVPVIVDEDEYDEE